MSLSRVGRSGIQVGTSPKKSRSLTDASGLPGPVPSFTATGTSTSTMSLSWTAPVISGDSAITTYSITNSPSGGSVSIAGTTATVTGLNPNTSYVFSIAAVNALGTGPIVSAAAASTFNFNDATGGTLTTVSNYNGTGQTWRVHTFTSSSSITVNRATENFSLLIAGGGGGGGGGICGTGQASCAGGGGGSGGFRNVSQTLSTGTQSVTVGTGALGTGGTSTFASLSSTGGNRGGGGGGGSAGTPGGNAGVGGQGGCGGTATSTISGTNTTYSGAGPGYYGINGCGGLQGGTWSSIRGGGGASSQRSGGDYPDGQGYNGIDGIVVIAYRSA